MSSIFSFFWSVLAILCHAYDEGIDDGRGNSASLEFLAIPVIALFGAIAVLNT